MVFLLGFRSASMSLLTTRMIRITLLLLCCRLMVDMSRLAHLVAVVVVETSTGLRQLTLPPELRRRGLILGICRR